MPISSRLSRRDFLKVSTALGGGLIRVSPQNLAALAESLRAP